MKATSFFFILACSALGQGKVLLSGSVSRDGLTIAYRTQVEPPPTGEELRLGGGAASSRDIWHRFLYYSKERKYFGYDILIVRQGEQYSLTLQPLSADPAKLRLPAGPWTLVPLPRTPGTQMVRGGETLAIDLLVNPSTGQKIVDYLTINSGTSRAVYTAEGPSRGFTLEDVSLEINAPRVKVNNELVPATANMAGAVSGPVVRFYLPDRGRFALTLAPYESLGFRRAGEVRGSTLTFTVGADTYSVECNGRIAPGSGAYYLYVHHDPNYRPKDPAAIGSFGLDAGDNAARMVPR